jgi:hypothetical protein
MAGSGWGRAFALKHYADGDGRWALRCSGGTQSGAGVWSVLTESSRGESHAPHSMRLEAIRTVQGANAATPIYNYDTGALIGDSAT